MNSDGMQGNIGLEFSVRATVAHAKSKVWVCGVLFYLGAGVLEFGVSRLSSLGHTELKSKKKVYLGFYTPYASRKF